MKIQLPEWMKRDSMKLPPWAKVGRAHKGMSIRIDVDGPRAYADWQKLLGIKDDQLDQYWLEVIYQCVKLDVQSVLANTQYDPRRAGQSAEIRISRAPDYALDKYKSKPGRGVEMASKGLEARRFYVKVRGALPM